jgi:hypothetical protein
MSDSSQLEDLVNKLDDMLLDNPGDTHQEVLNSMSLMMVTSSIEAVRNAADSIDLAHKQVRMAENVATTLDTGAFKKQSMCRQLTDTYQCISNEIELQLNEAIDSISERETD